MANCCEVCGDCVADNEKYCKKCREIYDLDHVEAPDECSHRFEMENKIKAIEMIDREVLKVLKEELETRGLEFSILLVTDHATPLALGTHTREPVPFAIYRSSRQVSNAAGSFDEVGAAATGVHYKQGYRLMDHFLQRA